jgi:hypothetical protein
MKAICYNNLHASQYKGVKADEKNSD